MLKNKKKKKKKCNSNKKGIVWTLLSGDSGAHYVGLFRAYVPTNCTLLVFITVRFRSCGQHKAWKPYSTLEDKGANKTSATYSHTGGAPLDCGGVSAAIFLQSDCLLRNPLCPLPSLWPGSRGKKNKKTNWLSALLSLLLFRRFWTCATSWWSCRAGTAGFCWAPTASSTSTTAPETSWWRRATLPPRWDTHRASYESLCRLPLTHHQSNLAELSVVQCWANTCCIVSSVISWEPIWDFLFFPKMHFDNRATDGQLCVLSVAPQRLLQR